MKRNFNVFLAGTMILAAALAGCGGNAPAQEAGENNTEAASPLNEESNQEVSVPQEGDRVLSIYSRGQRAKWLLAVGSLIVLRMHGKINV